MGFSCGCGSGSHMPLKIISVLMYFCAVNIQVPDEVPTSLVIHPPSQGTMNCDWGSDEYCKACECHQSHSLFWVPVKQLSQYVLKVVNCY